MVTISKARNSIRLQTYHEKELSNAEENYYTNKDRIDGEWRGQLALQWGLSGAITAEQFARLAEGQHPITGEQLVRHRLTTENAVGHRAGWDATFSAPKSVSLTALVGAANPASEAERRLALQVADAHRQAARIGSTFLERYAEARMGGNNPTQPTGKLATALFDHDSSRPVQGYAAPQLHTHVVIFNMTEDKTGKIRALNEKSLFEAQKTATAVYQAELRSRLERLGFQIEIGKNNAPEIAGYTTEYKQANSTRSEVIDERAEQIRQQLGVSKVAARQMAALDTREKKLDDTPEQMQAKLIARSNQHGHQEHAVLADALQRQLSIRAQLDQIDPLKEANKALTFARDHLFEYEAVNLETDLLRTALHRADGRATLQHIEAALTARRATREFIPMQTRAGRRAYTTAQVLQIESDNIRLMAEGRRHYAPLVSSDRIREQALSRLDSAGTGNQRDAAHQILTCCDRIQGLQGAAGTGKTFTLKTIREELQNTGWQVRGFAPTAKASKELAESGIHTTTLQKYLVDAEIHGKAKYRTVYVLDESSLADATQVNRLLKSLGPDDRLLLVGDIRQHESVGQGRAFAQLQEQGMSTAHLTKIMRQKDAPDLKRVVELFYEGHIHEGVAILNDLGCIKEVQNEQARYEAIAKEFMGERDHTLAISPDNRSRAGINAVIHKHLQEAGQLAQAETTLAVLVSRQDISGAERGWAKRYEVGNVLHYERPSKAFGFERGDYATVTAIDPKQNTITVAKSNGEAVTYDPERFCGPSSVSLYRPDEKAFSVGELIQFTSNSKALGISNRDRAVITGFAENGTVTATLHHGADKPPGRTLTIDPKQFAHIDHAYAVTSYSSQGLTERADILNIDTNNMNPQLINDRLAYVAGSRMKMKLTIYCNDATQLADALSRDISKTSAIRPAAEVQQERLERPALSTALDLLAKGDTGTGIEGLKTLGCVVEIHDDAERHRAVAKAYLAPEERPLLACPDHSACAALNDAVHADLTAGAKLAPAEITLPVLIRRQGTQQERTLADAYQVGDVIRYHDRPHSSAAHFAAHQPDYATVTATDPKTNTITVHRPGGAFDKYNPNQHSRVSVFRSAEKTFAVGETIRFTGEHHPLKINRDDRAKVLAITKDGKLTLRLTQAHGTKQKARVVHLDPANCPHLDHSYVAAAYLRTRTPQTVSAIIHLAADVGNVDALATRFASAARAARDPHLTIYCKDSQALADSLSRSLAALAQATAQKHQLATPAQHRAIAPASHRQSVTPTPMHHTNELRPTPPKPSEHDLSSTPKVTPLAPQQDRILRPPEQVPHRPAGHINQPGLRPAPPAPEVTQIRQPEHTTNQAAQHQPHLAPNVSARATKPPRAKAVEQELQQEEGLGL